MIRITRHLALLVYGCAILLLTGCLLGPSLLSVNDSVFQAIQTRYGTSEIAFLLDTDGTAIVSLRNSSMNNSSTEQQQEAARIIAGIVKDDLSGRDDIRRYKISFKELQTSTGAVSVYDRGTYVFEAGDLP